MATTPTDRVTALARRFRVEVDTATYPASQYQQIRGLQELKLVEELRVQSGETYDDAGAAREDVTGYGWRLEMKILRSLNAAGTSLDPVHAFLESRFHAAKNGVQFGELGIRWFDRNGVGSANEGRAYVKVYAPEGGDPGAQDILSVTIQGQGPLNIAAPNPAAASGPLVTGLSPAGGPLAAGTLVNIYGGGFKGTTGAASVKFGATNAVSYTVVSDSHIVAVAPSGTAGAVQVTVVNGGTSGTGVPSTYTYAA